MCNKAVDNYSYVLEFIPECQKKMCDKPDDTQATIIKYVPECYKTQEMCNKQFTDVFYLILFFVNIKLKKYVT